MKRLLFSSLTAAAAFAINLPVLADEVQTTIQTTQPTPQTQVIDSYMKPTVTETKSVTNNAGETQTSTAPLIQERHEHVVVPTDQITTTTTKIKPRVTTEEVITHGTAVRPVRHKVAHKVVHRSVAHTAKPHRSIAYTKIRKTVVQPEVIQQTQTVEQKGVLIDRPDPALNN